MTVLRYARLAVFGGLAACAAAHAEGSHGGHGSQGPHGSVAAHGPQGSTVAPAAASGHRAPHDLRDRQNRGGSQGCAATQPPEGLCAGASEDRDLDVRRGAPDGSIFLVPVGAAARGAT